MTDIKTRNEDIIQRFMRGETQPKIGEHYGLTRQAVSLILKQYGVCRKQGGVFVKRKLQRIEKERKRKEARKEWRETVLNDWCVKELGVSLEEAEKINGAEITRLSSWLNEHRSHRYQRYLGVKRQYERKHKEPYLNFRDWWELWQESGHWGENRDSRWCVRKINPGLPISKENVAVIMQGSWSVGRRKRETCEPDHTEV